MPKEGIILIDKPAGMTSFGVVARIRRVLSEKYQRKIKVGHTGTLDPFATGLMILVVGKTCRQAEKFSKLDKTYEAEIVLGKVSSTGDPEGEITEKSDTVPDETTINEVCQQFVGDLWQTPPAYSAIKIDGQRAYKLARQGKAVDVPKRKITIFSLEVIDYSYPIIKIRAHVSSGTYIRTLATDIGERLATGAYCRDLRRTAIADYSVSQAQSLADFGIKD